MNEAQAKEITLRPIRAILALVEECSKSCAETRGDYMGEAVRGLEWALDFEDGEPRSPEDMIDTLVQAARTQVWRAVASLLYSLEHMEPGQRRFADGRTYRRVTSGDFCGYLDEISDAVKKLQSLNDQIAKLGS